MKMTSQERQLARKTRHLLAVRFPKAIIPRNSNRQKVPLKLGIAKDILARSPELDPDAIDLMLARYIGGPKYQAALIEGAPRRDLDGLIAGHVTVQAARRAAIGLAGLRAHNARQEAGKAALEAAK
jgi:sRNA-binding protein